MAAQSNEIIFKTQVLPIMDSVMKDLRAKQLTEIKQHTNSLSYILACAAGPDGGISAQSASIDSLQKNGVWNAKHTEDYIQMVKAAVNKKNVEVTPEIEKMMIEKMIKDEVPKSSIEYIMHKTASNTLFYIPHELNKSPLENNITLEAEKQYNPTAMENGTASALGAAADYISMGGGGGLAGAFKYVGCDMALNAVIDQFSEPNTRQEISDDKTLAAGNSQSQKKQDYVPLVIDPKYREQYKVEKAQWEQEKRFPQTVSEPLVESTSNPQKDMVAEQVTMENDRQQYEQKNQTNQGGWNTLLSTVGLNGISDIGNNLGYVLAMLPDILVGLFTGKTKSLGLKDNLMPIASIVAGMFVKNPILKMVLIAMGGLNLLNKAGHEALSKTAAEESSLAATTSTRKNYKVYEEEPLNKRIQHPQIKGNCLIATIDKVPCTITLTGKVVEAYNQGALPLNTLANAILAKNDQMRQLASENYTAAEQQTQIHSLSQR